MNKMNKNLFLQMLMFCYKSDVDMNVAKAKSNSESAEMAVNTSAHNLPRFTDCSCLRLAIDMGIILI